jgi:hypothetical protein
VTVKQEEQVEEGHRPVENAQPARDPHVGDPVDADQQETYREGRKQPPLRHHALDQTAFVFVRRRSQFEHQDGKHDREHGV